MVLGILCVVFLSLEGNGKGHKSVYGVDIGLSKSFYATIAIVLGLLCPIIITIRQFFIKKFDCFYPAKLQIRDSVLTNSLIFSVVFFITIGVDEKSYNQITSVDYMNSFFVSALTYAAKHFFAQSVVLGYGGPAASLSSTSAIYTTILSTFQRGEPLSGWELSGLVLGIVGAIIVSFAHMCTCFSKKDDGVKSSKEIEKGLKNLDDDEEYFGIKSS
jgi:drug/metabolite transporter (DMT)-like permease